MIVANARSSTIPEFDNTIEDLERLVAAGHRQNVDGIEALMKRFSSDGLAARCLLLRLASHGIRMNLAGAQSFFLAASRSFALRLNVWYPAPRLHDVAIDSFNKYFSIGVCHNHNFDFFTTCVHGPGYASEFKSTTVETDAFEPGQRIPFDRKWTIKLGAGQSLFVPRDTVFHTQELPAAFSMTLNLIPFSGRSASGRQYTLEDDRETVRRVIIGEEHPSSHRSPL